MLICMGVRSPESFVEGEIYNEQLQTNATCYGNTHDNHYVDVASRLQF